MRNIEIKARVGELTGVRTAALAHGARRHVVEEQTDRYYALDGGRRVKLRTVAGGRAELIAYDRPEASGVRASDYTITAVRDGAGGACLVPKGEPLVVVRKQREVLLWDNVRIHLDAVEGLGTFLELEAVVGDAHDEARCRAQVAELMAALRIDAADLIRASYSELLLAGREAAG